MYNYYILCRKKLKTIQACCHAKLIYILQSTSHSQKYSTSPVHHRNQVNFNKASYGCTDSSCYFSTLIVKVFLLIRAGLYRQI